MRKPITTEALATGEIQELSRVPLGIDRETGLKKAILFVRTSGLAAMVSANLDESGYVAQIRAVTIIRYWEDFRRAVEAASPSNLRTE